MIENFLYVIFVIVMGLDAFNFFSYLLSLRKEERLESTSFLSVIIPVYDKEETIVDCIDSILKSDYPHFEIIVVDDGSRDSTLQMAGRIEGIKLVHQKHGGKHTALNLGIENAHGDVVIIDADTVIERRTLGCLASALLKYDGVSGNLRVIDGNLLQEIQAIEHVRAGMYRRIAARKGRLDIIPGPVGAFRRFIFEKLRFEKSLVEDLDFTLRMKREGFTVGYEPQALAYTRMPGNLRELLDQRSRWAHGNMVLALHRMIPAEKIIFSFTLASLDLLLLFLSLLSGNFLLLSVFIFFESLTMIVGNRIERTEKFLSSLLFPFFMWFLDAIIVSTYACALIRISTSAESHEW